MEFYAILENIGFDWRVAVANFVNFLIIFYLLKRFVFPALQETIRSREKKISDGLEHAKQARAELMTAEQQREELLAEARKEARHIVERARIEEKDIVQNAALQAEHEAGAIKARALEKVAHDREKMEHEMKEHAIDLSLRGAEKIIRVKLGDKEDRKLIEEALS